MDQAFTILTLSRLLLHGGTRDKEESNYEFFFACTYIMNQIWSTYKPLLRKSPLYNLCLATSLETIVEAKLIWQEKWEEKLNALKQQHITSTGEEMNLSTAEFTKLKHGAVPNTIASTLKVINQHMFPNIAYFLSLLAVLPITTYEAEHSISTL